MKSPPRSTLIRSLTAPCAFVCACLFLLAASSLAQQPRQVPWSEAVKPGSGLTVDWLKGTGVNLALQAQVSNKSSQPLALTARAGMTFVTPAPGTQIMLMPRDSSWEAPAQSSVTIVLPVVALNADRHPPTEYNYTWSYAALPPESPVRALLAGLANLEHSFLPRAAVGVAPQSQTETMVSGQLARDEFAAAVASQWEMDAAGSLHGRLSDTVIQYAVWCLNNGLTQAHLAQSLQARYLDWRPEERDRLHWQIAAGVSVVLLYAGADPTTHGWPLPDQAQAALLRIAGPGAMQPWRWAGPVFLGPGPAAAAFSPAPAAQWIPRLRLTNQMHSELTVWLKGPALYTLKVAPHDTFICDVLPGIYRYGAKIPEALVMTGVLAFEPYREYSWSYAVELPVPVGPVVAQVTLVNLTSDPLHLTVASMAVVVPAHGQKQIELAPGTYHYEGRSGNIRYLGERTFTAGPAEWRFSPPA